MLPYKDRKRAMLWLQEALLKAEENGVLSSSLAEHIRSTLELEWSNRMSRTVGLAMYSKKTRTALIRLSTILWEVASELEKRETVFHEVAHIIVDATQAHSPAKAKFRGRQNAHHGPDWVRVMTAIGYPNPKRCHDLWNAEHERAQGNVPLYCQCKSEPIAWATPEQAEKATRHRHKKCLGLFSLTPTSGGKICADLNEIFDLLADGIDPRAYNLYNKQLRTK